MTAILGFLAMFTLIAWLARRPSSELFAEADSYYSAAERWRRVANDPRELPSRISTARVRTRLCLEAGAVLTRKALRRMPWKLI